MTDRVDDLPASEGPPTPGGLRPSTGTADAVREEAWSAAVGALLVEVHSAAKLVHELFDLTRNVAAESIANVLADALDSYYARVREADAPGSVGAGTHTDRQGESGADAPRELRELLVDWLDKPHKDDRWVALRDALGPEWADVENPDAARYRRSRCDCTLQWVGQKPTYDNSSCPVHAEPQVPPPSASGQTQARESAADAARVIELALVFRSDLPARDGMEALRGLLADLAAAERLVEQLREALAPTAETRDYLSRTIATIRNHRDADNCWPQWANRLADEVERMWGALADVGGQESAREKHPGAGGEQP